MDEQLTLDAELLNVVADREDWHTWFVSLPTGVGFLHGESLTRPEWREEHALEKKSRGRNGSHS